MKLYKVEVVEGFHDGFEPITSYQILETTEADVRDRVWVELENVTSIVSVEEI